MTRRPTPDTRMKPDEAMTSPIPHTQPVEGLDTSGVVTVDGVPYSWDGEPTHDLATVGLRPFEQGYVEAALRDARLVHWTNAEKTTYRWARFSDDAPSTLAAMLKDCAEFQSRFGEWPKPEHGAGFWTGRQARRFDHRFPPLTLYLSDDGLIYQQEASQ